MKRSILTTVFFIITGTLYANGVYNIRDFGAKGDGETLDHISINKAVDVCANAGGGQVLVPSGTYLCGSIRLKSNVDLHLMPGATILAAPSSMKAYDESEYFGGPEYQDGGHTYFHNSLIWAESQTNISISGLGMIDGNGLTKNDTEYEGAALGGSIGTGDKSIAFKSCRNAHISDITIYRGGHFAIIMTGCDLGSIDNVTIDTNRDGIDIDCCKFISVNNTKVNSPHDDAIVLKSSYALKKPVLCEHILITNCTVSGFEMGTLLDGSYKPAKVGWGNGRIKLGTESNGGFRNIAISNCSFAWCSGLALEVVDRGVMENIVVSNITMSHTNHYPIYITTGRRNRGPEENKAVSSAKNIKISNVIVDDADNFAGIIITGMKGYPIRNVSLNDIYIQYKGGGSLLAKAYPELDATYPEPKHLGPTPAYGLYARHINGLTLDNVKFDLKNPDQRKEIILDNVKGFKRK